MLTVQVKIKMKSLLFVTILGLSLISTSFAQKLLADRDVEGFKGEVKAVTIERADLNNVSGKWVEGKRMPESYTTYDPDGNRVVEKIYEDGNLSSSGIYSLLNGDRVLIPDKIEIDNSREIIEDMGPSNKKELPRDERYTEKYKYKYDAKGMKREEIVYQNDGSFWSRNVFTLKGNQREKQIYDEKGKFNYKYVYILDDKGNEVEMRSFGPGDKFPDWKENYKNLEFDSKGNWTKRIRSQSYNENGKYLLRSTTVFYRTISYY